MSVDDRFDVAVVGAGVVGTAVARELAGHGLSVAVVDAADDVGEGTSKANTAILHTGFDAAPGSLEARLVRRGYALLSDYAEAAGIAVEHTGALLVAWDEDQLAALPALAAKAEQNGYQGTRAVGASELYLAEPHLGPGALGALEVPDESIVCPWTPPLAFATEAVADGAELLLGRRVQSVLAEPGSGHELRTTAGPVRCRWLVNAAGLHADTVDAMLGHHDVSVTPRRGELVVFDKLARPLVRHILLPVPTARGKGVLVAPTVFGNVLLGPTAEDVGDRTDTGSTAAGLAMLRERGRRIMPDLLAEEVTAVYAGLRAATERPDYWIALHADQQYLTIAGIRSTGLTASLAIAEHVAGLLGDGGLRLGARRPARPPRMPQLGEAGLRPYQRGDLIAADREYGTIVCHCERVSAGEIRDAMTAPVPARSLDGLRRRTRALNGRCQGFYCGAEVRGRLEAPQRAQPPAAGR
jgi:glycerol-3-phosphate dehydrogenase